MNLVSSVDSVSLPDQYHRDNIFNLFVTFYNLYLDVLFLFFQMRIFFTCTQKRGRG